MGSRNYLFDHLADKKNRDLAPPRLIERRHSGRLCLGHSREHGGWNVVANWIRKLRRSPVSWFLDANVAILDQAEPVWTAFRLAALQSNETTALISPFVARELTAWLDEPFRNKARADAICAGLQSDNGWISYFGLNSTVDFDLSATICAYVTLLGIRRQLALPATDDGRTAFGVEACSKGPAMNAIKDRLGLRAQTLARKGRDDSARTGAPNCNDEAHCMLAIVHALQTKKRTVILTADYDLLEIFYKAQWFLDTHYRGWLAAKLIRDGRFGSPVRYWTDPERRFFRGPLALYPRHTLNVSEVLPPKFTPVEVDVCYVSPHNEIHTLGFRFEQEMLGLLSTKAMSGGRATDLFGDSNIHVDLGPLCKVLGGLYLGVGKDNETIADFDGKKMAISYLDAIHCIHCNERILVKT